jgi:endogenous inhibitor of DNA gyrase (YacG/DUF329 family)
MPSSKCPTCGRPLDLGAEPTPFRPFCSERCRTADLGAWLDGAYRIGSPVSEEDLDAGIHLDGEGHDDGAKTRQ